MNRGSRRSKRLKIQPEVKVRGQNVKMVTVRIPSMRQSMSGTLVSQSPQDAWFRNPCPRVIDATIVNYSENTICPKLARCIVMLPANHQVCSAPVLQIFGALLWV
ncbi:hypothetical protein CPB83DRAFT_430051 [Crepidotus variabilis]|uniref:Uncharacterized protein n=1 Tax=Crepidotus variabilis TaxID=179855 RepID=A0A9P6ECU0_9AGAR|nr:hypothetical protein CPB83DRAFT_430051 [Crepidotus variabilis]